jgi:Na+/melibiose symporter-like transporter
METRPFTSPTPSPETGNGHANSEGLHSHLHYYSQRDNDRETTRYLSAATQINLDYARRVVAQVVHEPYRALAPAHGADVTVVARWALDSLRRIALRDAVLTMTLIVGVFFSWLFGAVVQASPWVVFATVLVMFGIAFFAIAYEHWIRWYRILAGQMLRDEFDPEKAPEPATERVNLRLQAAADRKSGNLVVFGEHGPQTAENLGLEHRQDRPVSVGRAFLTD